MEVQAELPLPKAACAMAASSDGKLLAITDWKNSIYLCDGKQVWTYLNLTPARLGALPHFIAFLAVIGIWIAMRVRRKNRAAKKDRIATGLNELSH
jgi:hypothetical protein